MAISDGTYTFAESEDEKVFYLYRNDDEKLGDVGRMPMEFYQAYLTNKMMSGGITKPVFGNLRFDTSTDDKIIRVTVIDYKELSEIDLDSTDDQKQPNFLKRLFQKLWKHKHKDQHE